MIKLSIIIPFYNVENYISECIDSVLQQDIPTDEYEIICINDASPDNSRDIVLEYQKKHRNLKLIEHTRNKKVGAARNTGFEEAKGKYIWHIDSDDKIVPNCLKEIISVCEKNELDMLELGYTDQYGNKLYKHLPVRDNIIHTGVEYLNKFYNNLGDMCCIWSKIYNRDFLLKNDIKNPPINMGEDEPFALQVFTLSKKVAFHHKDCYIYRINETSLTGTHKCNWSALRWYEASITCSRFLDEAFMKIKKNMDNKLIVEYRKLIKYDLTLWESFPNNISSDTISEYWKLCRIDFMKNIFVFKYLGRKSSIHYLCNILSSFKYNKKIHI